LNYISSNVLISLTDRLKVGDNSGIFVTLVEVQDRDKKQGGHQDGDMIQNKQAGQQS
jgi:hypothetical protein